jgi:hypothetical protein
MGRVKKFTGLRVRTISGGKDPARLVNEFIVRQGHNPEECLKDQSSDTLRWVIELAEHEELEILVESLRTPSETTVYMGVNVAIVPIRGAVDVLAAALEIADGLIGIKVSLVNHYLVLSASLGLAGLTVEELDYHYKLIAAQQDWFTEALADELGWESLPEE